MTYRGRLLFPAAVALLTICAVRATAQPDSPQDADIDLFADESRVWTVHIRLTEERWRMMQPGRARQMTPIFAGGPPPVPAAPPATRPAARGEPYREGDRLPPNAFGWQFAYVRGEFQIEGETWRDVGVRFAGNASYNAAMNAYNRPYKIDFNRFVPGQKFRGHGTLNLHNNAYDPSLIREMLSYRLFRDAGVAAPRTAFALLYLTIDGRCQREYLGPYTITEEVDDRPFLQRNFGTSKGLILKPERIRGLVYFGEDYNAYLERYRPKTDAEDWEARRLIDFVKLVNFADDETFVSEIESHVAVDTVLRMVAVNALLVNMDSFLNASHNYYMFLNRRDRLFHFTPWDMHLGVGSIAYGSQQQMMAMTVLRPWTEYNRLCERLFAIDMFAARYRQILAEMLDGPFAPQRVLRLIDTMQQTIRRADEVARAALPAGRGPAMPATWSGRTVPEVRSFLEKRLESAIAQIRDDEEGYMPSRGRGGGGGLFNALSRRRSPAWASAESLGQLALKAADANGDGTADMYEIASAARALAGWCEADAGGLITATSLAGALAAILPAPRPATMPATAPAYGRRRWFRPEPAAMTPDEVASTVAASVVREAGNNVRPGLTPDDMVAAALRIAREADRNWDGRLDQAEMIDALNRLPATGR